MNCTLNELTLCLKKNVVYEVECNRCHGTYFGSTIRPLHQRIKEHLQQTSSAVFQHLSSYGLSQGIKVTTLKVPTPYQLNILFLITCSFFNQFLPLHYNKTEIPHQIRNIHLLITHEN
jgi:hypothetical protein